MNIFNKFNNGLQKTSSFFSKNLLNALSAKTIDDNTLEEIESILISSDIGIEATNNLIKKIKKSKIQDPKDLNLILETLSEEIEMILKPREKKLSDLKDNKPNTFLFIGVNGSGKTTTIGKLIHTLPKDKKILVAACDTFRAAAVEQLKDWASKEKTDFFKGSLNQDPASVAFSACKKAQDEKYDYLIIDTAGRLSNNANLLNQLVKIRTVIDKIIEDKCIKTILVLDGTNGSNMINQVDIFNKSLNVSGLIITKIDGTAKGGALISVANKYEIPIYFVGLGEKTEDLHIFNSKLFAQSMLGVVK